MTRDTRDERFDADLDAELRRLVNAAPAPDFVARVRAKVASVETARGWRFGWAGAAGTLAAAGLLVILAVLPSATLDDRETGGLPDVNHAADGASIAGASFPEPVANPPAPSFPEAPRVSARERMPRSPRTEVLIAERDREALESLLVTRSGLAFFAPESSDQPLSVLPLLDLDAVEVSPVVVEPLAPITE